MIDVKIRSVVIVPPERQNDAVSYKLLAFGKVDVPELFITLNGVSLTWSEDHGYWAQPPNAPVRGDFGMAVKWVQESPLAKVLREKLIVAYEALGGELPAPFNNEQSVSRRFPRHERVAAANRNEPDNSGLKRLVGGAE